MPPETHDIVDIPESRWPRIPRVIEHFENSISAMMILLMALVPVIEMTCRRLFNWGIPGATDYLQHLTLWVGFFGAVLAVREERHLKIATVDGLFPERYRRYARGWFCFVSSFVCWGLCGASIQMVVAEAPPVPDWVGSHLPGAIVSWLEPFGLFAPGANTSIGGLIPTWVAESIMPIGFAALAIRYIFHSSKKKWVILSFFSSLPGVILLSLCFPECPRVLVIFGIVLLVCSGLVGVPIFVLLGGSAMLLFWGDGVTTAAIPAEMYRIVVSPVFPTIPLFTLAGFVLSESRASERLVNVFQSLFGWVPGGTAVAVTLLCAFFTTFTGASGITILALGGLLLPVLRNSGYGEKFSIGLLTATGSIGLLFPPSLVIILYGVIAKVSIEDMFKAGIMPGILMVFPVCAMCVVQGVRTRHERVDTPKTRFEIKKALFACWVAKWELLIPVVALYFIFSGLCTVVEAAAITVVYTIIVETLIHRDVNAACFYQLLVKCVILVGGVLIVLGVAMGLTSYLVDAQVPAHAADWAHRNLHSTWAFLLVLNLGLILAGCMMDIFSALIIVVPLILPIAESFQVNPIHLGIIFLANLQLGYLTPPVGMNLFLAAFRFDKPFLTVARAGFPFLILFLLVVILITYVPWFSLAFLS